MILMILAPLIGVIGAALFSYGAWLVFPPAGFITAGVLCLSGHGLYQNICPRHVMFKTKAVIDVLSRIVSKSNTPVTTPAELAEAVGMTYDTYTGKRVSSQKAMRLTAVFGCIRVLAESMGMLPCNLYKVTGNSKQKATSERLHKLLTMKPNDYMTPQEFWELVIVCLCLRGNFYAYKVKALGKWLNSCLLIPVV
jgi:hypothetical protein